jgi:hypothetical protein
MRGKDRAMVIVTHFIDVRKVWKGMKVTMKVEAKLAQDPSRSM